GFPGAFKDAWHRFAVCCAEAELPSGILQVAVTGPQDSSRSDGKYRVAQSLEGAAQITGRTGSDGDARASRAGGVASTGTGHRTARPGDLGAVVWRRPARV